MVKNVYCWSCQNYRFGRQLREEACGGGSGCDGGGGRESLCVVPEGLNPTGG